MDAIENIEYESSSGSSSSNDAAGDQDEISKSDGDHSHMESASDIDVLEPDAMIPLEDSPVADLILPSALEFEPPVPVEPVMPPAPACAVDGVALALGPMS